MPQYDNRDVFAVEQSWKLVETNTGIVVRDIPFGTYTFNNKIKEVVELTAGTTYDFTILDNYGDGITNKGSYRIYIVNGDDGEDENGNNHGDDDEGNEIDMMLVNELGDFRRERTHTFTVPMPMPMPSMPSNEESAMNRQQKSNRIGQISDPLP